MRLPVVGVSQVAKDKSVYKAQSLCVNMQTSPRLPALHRRGGYLHAVRVGDFAVVVRRRERKSAYLQREMHRSL